MTKQLELTKEQQVAYDRFIKLRDKIGYGSKSNKVPWVKQSTIAGCVDVEGLNHPVFIINDVYLEYLDAFQAWLDIEPKFRQEQRMRASRGDYGQSDSWDSKQSSSQDVYNKIKEG